MYNSGVHHGDGVVSAPAMFQEGKHMGRFERVAMRCRDPSAILFQVIWMFSIQKRAASVGHQVCV